MPRRAAVPSRVPSPSDQLAALIRSCGRSPAALAAAAEVAPSVLSRFLSGERGISSETFDRIAAALGGLRLVPIGRGRGKARAARAETAAEVPSAHQGIAPAARALYKSESPPELSAPEGLELGSEV